MTFKTRTMLVSRNGCGFTAIWAIAVGAGCGRPGPMPVQSGFTMTLQRAVPRSMVEAPLQMRLTWLGTACHVMQLGDATILTDPFFSHHRISQVALGPLRSDVDMILSRTAGLPQPSAVFVGHSHYDHMLDIAEMYRQRDWWNAPIFGGRTTCNLLSSYPERERFHLNEYESSDRWNRVPTTGKVQIEYRAVLSEHAPHALGVLWYDGEVERPLSRPPNQARHFRVGGTYALYFRLTANDRSYTVCLIGAAANPPHGFPPPDVEQVDVLILCVPGWEKARDYPTAIVARLRPRHIVLSHYNDFFQVDQSDPRLAPMTSWNVFLKKMQDDCRHPELERIWIPSVGSSIEIS